MEEITFQIAIGLALVLFLIVLHFAIKRNSVAYDEETEDIQRRVHAGQSLGAPTDRQARNTAKLEKQLRSRTNVIKSPRGVSSNAKFYGPRDNR